LLWLFEVFCVSICISWLLFLFPHRMSLEFWWDCIEHVDCFWWYGHFHNVERSFHLLISSLISLFSGL
jgi:hypothetical protein